MVVIHVQYIQTESLHLRHFTIRLDSHITSQLDSHSMMNCQQGKRFVSIRSNRLESTTFSTTLYRPPEVKIREITIHETSLFLKCGHKLQLIHMIHVDLI